MNTAAIGRYRWTICALLFFATTVNYLDRQVLSLLQPRLEEIFHWSYSDYANITSVFQFTYALSMLFAGRIIDKLGTKKGYAWAIVIWSFGALIHAQAVPIGENISAVLGWVGISVVGVSAISIAGFMFARAVLAFGEAGNFPAAIKATAEYFPKKERSFATGIFNSGANVGAILAPLTVPWIEKHWGWTWAFIIIGGIGLIWLFFWLAFYDRPTEQKRLSAEELNYIRSGEEEVALENTDAGLSSKNLADDQLIGKQEKDLSDREWQKPQGGSSALDKDSKEYNKEQEEFNKDAKESSSTSPLRLNSVRPEKISWVKLLGYRQTWAFTIGKFLTDGVWWFFLFWLPSYLKAQYGIVNEAVMLPLATLYTLAMVGSIGGGWFPMYFIKKGYKVYNGRMRAMLMIAVFPLVVLAAQPLGDISYWIPVILIGIGAAAHQAWSANIFTTVSDMFPQKAIGSVVGIGGMAGGLGGVIMSKTGGALFDHYKALGHVQTGYTIMFAICAVAYLVAWSIMKSLVPRYEPITDL